MIKIIMLLLGLLLSSSSFAGINCAGFPLPVGLSDHYVIIDHTQAHKIHRVPAQVHAGYSWGGLLLPGTNQPLPDVYTLLLCQDADQFFQYQDNQGNYCVFDSDVDEAELHYHTMIIRQQSGLRCSADLQGPRGPAQEWLITINDLDQ